MYSNLTELKVSIQVSYTPPVGDLLRPPDYRVATSVTLTCVVEGASGSVSYRWSSTCTSSDCFARSSTSSTLTESFLRYEDAGNHTCTVTDGYGNTGSSTTEMRIIGV